MSLCILVEIKLNQLYKNINYTFKDESLAKSALTHRSASRDHNERLEFLGDSLLNCVIAILIYQQYQHADEGVLSRYRAILVKEKTLASIGRNIEMGKFLVLGVGEIKSGGNNRDSILADSLEALIGAVYLDSDFKTCYELVQQLFYDQIQLLAQIEEIKDPKSRLQELLQAKQMPLPVYQLIRTSGQAHAREFVVECRTQALTKPTQGTGSSRRKAEQNAAANALNLLQT